MYDEILTNASFPEALAALDRQLAQRIKEAGCGHCGGVLDVANYDRKLRGGPFEVDEKLERRLSLCCRTEGCRRRATPPSVLFLGRRVYVSVVVVLAAVLRQGPTPWRVKQLSAVLGADRRTLSRWRRWWIDRLGTNKTFEIGRAEFMPPPACDALPLSLLESFLGSAGERMESALQWLAEKFGAHYPREASLYAEVAR